MFQLQYEINRPSIKKEKLKTDFILAFHFLFIVFALSTLTIASCVCRSNRGLIYCGHNKPRTKWRHARSFSQPSPFFFKPTICRGRINFFIYTSGWNTCFTQTIGEREPLINAIKFNSSYMARELIKIMLGFISALLALNVVDLYACLNNIFGGRSGFVFY